MLTSIVEFACSNFCATTTQVKMKVSNKREKGGWGVWDSNETWAPNCKKIATRIISFSFIHLLSKTQNESVTKGEKKKQKKLKEIKITHSAKQRVQKKVIFQEWGKEKEKTRRRKLTPSRSGW
jgi:hypothetical protein